MDNSFENKIKHTYRFNNQTNKQRKKKKKSLSVT